MRAALVFLVLAVAACAPHETQVTIEQTTTRQFDLIAALPGGADREVAAYTLHNRASFLCVRGYNRVREETRESVETGEPELRWTVICTGRRGR